MLRSYARHVRLDIDHQLDLAVPGTPGFREKMRRGFEFLRTHAARHYTNDSLMRVLYASDAEDDGRGPLVLSMESPYTFDEETEVKSGGTLGVLVQLNDGTGRALCAVARAVQRNGVASAMLKAHTGLIGAPTFWVGRRNVDAQMFLLKQDYRVHQMNSRGALRFVREDYEDVGSEE